MDLNLTFQSGGMRNGMKKTIDVNTKRIKTFSYDIVRTTTAKIDKEINEFLKGLDAEEVEIDMQIVETLLIVVIIYERED